MSRKSDIKIGRIFFWWTAAFTCIITLIASDFNATDKVVWFLVATGLALTAAVFEHGWFVAPHWLGMVPRAVVILATICGLVGWLGYTVWPRCSLSVRPESHMLARLYARGALPPPTPNGESHSGIVAQELFYQWNGVIQSQHKESDIAISVGHLSSLDRIRVAPTGNSEISDLIPRWESGFQEPNRSPAYYSRTVHVRNIQKDQPVEVTIRRPIVIPQVMDLSALTISLDITTALCDWHKAATAGDELQKIKSQAEYLLTRSYSGVGSPPPPITISGLGDPQPGQLQATVEMHCDQDVECHKGTVRQLEASLKWW